MVHHSSDHLNPAFAMRCAGYLTTLVATLVPMRADLLAIVGDRYPSHREAAILSAIGWMINHPQETVRIRRKIKLRGRPMPITGDWVSAAKAA